ncbi:Tumor necrosis factor TNF-alpha [Triplophysa tibetana]|uniref:Tumor necrosis factor n=1 Tax=Triplophysa tibetana TaxID=1572043 RepID=A0A5A9NMF3_9TELE|nr:Tumor necrosis factor TNF-alpha [Triplophysa tibetana]
MLDIEQPLPVVRRSGSSKSGIWRMCGALLAVALCAAGAVCFTSNKSPDSQDEGSAGDVFNGSSLEWQDDMDQAFFQGGLKLVGNEIVIPNDGIYFIYSQVSFRVNCKSNREEDHEIVHVSHEVMRSSDAYSNSHFDSKADSKPLFNALRSACVQVPDSEQSWYSTIYFGAAFRLYAGDRLFTVTTRPMPDSEQSWYSTIYFGAAFRLYAGDRLFTVTTRPSEFTEVENDHGKNFFGAFAL